MPLYSFEGHHPVVHGSAWIAPTAVLIGDVTVEEGASIWFGTVLRADFGPIYVRAGANVQDGSVLHAGHQPADVGPGATIGHLCMVHGALIGAESLIGNGAIVLDGAVIGPRSLVAAGSVVTPRTEIPGGVMALGAPARVQGPLNDANAERVVRNGAVYRTLAQRYASTLAEFGH